MRRRLAERRQAYSHARTRPRRPRARLTGCLLWVLVLIILLIILGLMFGGFRKGTKAAGVPVQLERLARPAAAATR